MADASTNPVVNQQNPNDNRPLPLYMKIGPVLTVAAAAVILIGMATGIDMTVFALAVIIAMPVVALALIGTLAIRHCLNNQEQAAAQNQPQA